MSPTRPRGRLLASSMVTAALLVLVAPLGVVPAAAAPAPDEGASVADEIAATEQQELFTAFLTDRTERDAASVVDHAWHGDHGTIVVTPAAVEATQHDAATRGVRIDVQAASADALSFDERAGVEQAALALAADLPATSMAARYDPARHTVVLTAYADDPQAVTVAMTRILAREAQADSIGPALAFEVEGAADAPQATADIQGGRPYATCTGGFVGTKGGSHGILTAAHCTTKPFTYDGAVTGATYTAGNRYDVRFTALSGGTPKNQIWTGSSYRSITSTGTVTVGARLYKYGKTTGYGTTTVERYHGCVYYGNAATTYCGLFYTVDDIVNGGDSGGPWFVGSRGYAFTSGERSGSGSFIAPISGVRLISGASVKTS